jgi:hypothetical protein
VAALLVILSLPAALAAADANTEGPPTAVEQALIEHRCGATRATSAPDTDAYDKCLNGQLESIRSDFGRDLSRLSPAERRATDAVCNRIRNAEGRDAYVACLSGQLIALRARRNHETPAVAEQAAVVPIAVPAPENPPMAPRSSPLLMWIGASAAAVFVGGAGAMVALKRRPLAATACRVCGVRVSGGGDLCPPCRHDAAESLRRASLERVEAARAQEDLERRQREQEEELSRRKVREDEEMRLLIEARAREEEQARREAEARRQEEAVREREHYGLEEDVFDPHAILGLPSDADRGAIESAYTAARSKYDADQVAHLSEEVQQHFRLKAAAVERAYQLLTA